MKSFNLKSDEASSEIDDKEMESLKYICDICKMIFTEQFKFFEHLKAHYETSPTPQTSTTSMSDLEAASILVEASIPSTSHSQATNNRLIQIAVAAQSEDLKVDHLKVEDNTQKGIRFVSPNKKAVSKQEQPASSSINSADIVSKSSFGENTATLSLVEDISDKMLLTCPKCRRTFRKEKTYQVHIEACQKGDEDENRKIEKPKSKNKRSKPKHDIVIIPDTGDVEQQFLNESVEEPELDIDGNNLEEDMEYVGDEDGDGMLPEESMCPGCDEMYLSKSRLEAHIKTTHPDLIFTLHSPDKKFKKKGVGQRRQEVLKCPECERIFNHRNSLVYHMRSHTGERPHQCELCGKSFFATSALKVHMRLHSGEKPYKCEHCGRHFRQWGDLKYHVISIHSDIRQYQCEFCGKDFARKYSLIVHRRIHTGERNYKCEFCGKCFRAASYLQNHRRIHTGEKPHACSICGKPFRVRSDMKRHMASHSRDHNNHNHSSENLSTTTTSISNPQSTSHSIQSGTTVVTVSNNAANQLISAVGPQMSQQLVQAVRGVNQTVQIPVSGASQLVQYEVQHVTLEDDDAVISGDIGDATPINITLSQEASGSDGTLSVAAVATLQASDIPEGVIYQNRDGMQMEAVTIRESTTGTLYVWPVFMN